MKIIFFLFLPFLMAAQTVVLDTTYFEVVNGTNFNVRVVSYSNGSQEVQRTVIDDIAVDFANRLANRAGNFASLAGVASSLNERITRLIRENARVKTQTNVDVMENNVLAIQASMVGTWNILDYDRASTVNIAFNAVNKKLRWGGAQGDQIFALSQNVIYLRNWRTRGLLLFSDDGLTWRSLGGNIVLTKQ